MDPYCTTNGKAYYDSDYANEGEESHSDEETEHSGDHFSKNENVAARRFSDAGTESDKDSDLESENEAAANESDENLRLGQFYAAEKALKRARELDNEEPIAKKQKRGDKDLFVQPTVEELNQLRETETLFHSNLFRLQIEQVLETTKVKIKYKKLFDQWLTKFKNHVRSIEESEEMSLAEAEAKLPVEIPQPPLPADEKGVFKFLTPTDIRVIGSYGLGVSPGPNINIDVMVEMPAKIFRKLDHRNYRYAKKRAIYLSWIAANLSGQLGTFHLESKKFVGNSWMPILCLKPKGKLGKRVTVHVHLSAEEGSFKLNKFLPDKNGVRAEWYLGDNNTSEEFPPTPHYNSIVLRDLTMSPVNESNLKIIEEYPHLQRGIILLKIWLRQRQPNDSVDSFSNHILTMYVLYLFGEMKLNFHMSSYQMVRNVWNNLALSDWSENGITMCPNTETRLVEYKKHFDCVFIDPTGYHNLAAHLSIDTFHWVRDEAARAMKYLDDPNVDSFQTLFMRPVSVYRAFDNLICFNDGDVFEKIVEDKCSVIDKLDYGPDKRARAIKILSGILKEALGKRISNLFIQSEKQKEWDVKEKAPDTIGRIVIGLSLDPEHCFNIIDKGPHANLEEAAAFRKFWGNKSELRRFQDASICEALVWIKRKHTIALKRSVCKKIVNYILKEKLDISNHQYEYVADESNEYLQLKTIQGMNVVSGTGEEATMEVLSVMDNLQKELTSLTDLPLSISGVQGCSPVFRYSEVFPPLPYQPSTAGSTLLPGINYLTLDENSQKIPYYLPPIHVSLQLALSGKWPDELEAVRKTKAAFHIQIAEGLRKQHGLKAQAQYQYLDVFKEGYVFRLEVANQKEIALLKRDVSDDRMAKYRENEESIELEKRLFHLPKLSSAFNGINTQQPAFGTTCCLAKRWLSAQLIDDSNMPDIVVELVVASIFLTPNPYKPAQTPQIAFLRLLEFLARRQWIAEPIFVNFNNEMTREEIVAAEIAYRSNGDSNPPMFISTPYDHNDSMWTRKSPTLLILNRIAALAKQALKIIDKQLDNGTTLNFRGIFVAPETEYDILIRLRSSSNSRRFQFYELPAKFPVINFSPFDKESNEKIPIIAFNPVDCYLRELRRAYGDSAVFFHDTYGGLVIGVLLKPDFFETKEFKIANIRCRQLDEDLKLKHNISAIMEDLSILGAGLVRSISLTSKRYGTSRYFT